MPRQDETTYQALDETTYLVELGGEFAFATPKALRNELLRLIESGKRLVVDLSDLTDEPDLGALVAVIKRARELGRVRAVVLVVHDERLTRVFKTTGLDRVFPIYTSRRDAIMAIGCNPELPQGKDYLARPRPVREEIASPIERTSAPPDQRHDHQQRAEVHGARTGVKLPERMSHEELLEMSGGLEERVVVFFKHDPPGAYDRAVIDDVVYVPVPDRDHYWYAPDVAFPHECPDWRRVE